MCWENDVGVDVNKCVLVKDKSVWGAAPITFLSYRDSKPVHYHVKETELCSTEYCWQILIHNYSSQNFPERNIVEVVCVSLGMTY